MIPDLTTQKDIYQEVGNTYNAYSVSNNSSHFAGIELNLEG